MQINKPPSPDSQINALNEAVFAKPITPALAPEKEAKPVYGPPAPPQETYAIPPQGKSQADYPFYDAAEPLLPNNLVDKLREDMGEKAFLGVAGVAVAGALAAGSKVKLKLDVEDQVQLPNARLELSMSLKENRQARELRERGPAALINPGQAAPQPRGAGLQVGFTTEF